MTGPELYTLFGKLITDTGYDETHAYQLLSQSKNRIERLLKLAILQSVDQTKTASPGDTYLTMKNLPSDFREMISLFVGNYEFFPIPFAKRIAYRNQARRYYIDLKNNQFALTGSIGSASTISQTYLIKTSDIDTNTEEGDILWPSEFQPLIAHDAAAIQLGTIDPDDIAVRQSNANSAEYNRLLDGLIGWDADMKLSEMNHQRDYADDVNENISEIDLGLM